MSVAIAPTRSPTPSSTATPDATPAPKKATGFGTVDSFERTRRTSTVGPPQRTVITGDVTIRTAADLAQLKGVKEITGKLTIAGDLTSLAGLESLTTVGSLEVKDTQLTSLAGLSGLQTIKGSLNIGAVVKHGDDGFVQDVLAGSNPRLTTLGLSSLRSVGGDVSIVSNPMLAKLDGLEGLRSVGGQLDVFYNAALRDVSLPNLESVGRLQIGHSPLLNSPSAGKYVVFPHGNDQLASIDLPKLARAQSVVVADNNALESARFGELGANGSKVDRFIVSTNPALAIVSAPKLEVVGDLNISQSAGMKVRDAAGNVLYDPPIGAELRTIDLPKLRSATNLSFGMLPVLETLALPSLENVSGEMFVSNNPLLRSFDAPRLREITGIAYIGENAALASLGGLGGLEKVGSLHLTELPALGSLEGLGALRTIIGDLRVAFTGVGDASARAFAERVGVGGDVTIEEN